MSGFACKYFEKTEEGEPSGVRVCLLNRKSICVFAVLLDSMHLLFELFFYVETTSTII